MATAPFYIVGPTASGKSALALALTECRPGAFEIVNADAFQLYRGIDTLTAAPTAAERAAAPHHLYGVLAPSEDCDAARFAALAEPVLCDIAARGKTALVVGGSGLYLKALTHGLATLPAADPALRERLRAMADAEKIALLHQLDPAGAGAVNPGNPRHVERALEICLLTGQPASERRTGWQKPADPTLRGVFLAWPRDLLCQRIHRRTTAILAAGAVGEVARIDAAGGFSRTSEKAIGLRECRAIAAGTMSVAEAVEVVETATRQYAKRQTTWFRRETWLTPLPCHPDTTAKSLAHGLLPRLGDPS